MSASETTEAMRAARTVNEMADAFHPDELSGEHAHRSPILDVIEAALMFGAGRIPASDFLSAVDDCPEATDAIRAADWRKFTANA